MSTVLQSQLGSNCTFSHFCPLLNISQCHFTESNDRFMVNIYNPIARVISPFIRIPVRDNASYRITNSAGHPVASQTVPVPSSVLSVPGRNSQARWEQGDMIGR